MPKITPQTGPQPPAPRLPRRYNLYCPTGLTAPRTARTYVAGVLHRHTLTGLLDDAVLCTSELMTNACVHAKGAGGAVLRMAVDVRGPVPLRVTVYDGDATAGPRLLEGYEPESGRGLWLVDMLSRGRWGTVPGAPLPGGGKGVWFELGAPGAADSTPPAHFNPNGWA